MGNGSVYCRNTNRARVTRSFPRRQLHRDLSLPRRDTAQSVHDRHMHISCRNPPRSSYHHFFRDASAPYFLIFLCTTLTKSSHSLAPSRMTLRPRCAFHSSLLPCSRSLLPPTRTQQLKTSLGISTSSLTSKKGYFRETFRDARTVDGNRSVSTAIYYLLEGSVGFSSWHRVDVVEVWYACTALCITHKRKRWDLLTNVGITMRVHP